MSIAVRAGRPRNHREGISINIYRDIGTTPTDTDSMLLAQVYGVNEEQARMRAQIAASAFADYYCARVKL